MSAGVPKNRNLHRLKIRPEFFRPVVYGQKKAEVRKDDRGFEEGDVLFLQEYHTGRGYTGRAEVKIITHITRGEQYGIKPGYCVLSLGNP